MFIVLVFLVIICSTMTHDFVAVLFFRILDALRGNVNLCIYGCEFIMISCFV